MHRAIQRTTAILQHFNINTVTTNSRLVTSTRNMSHSLYTDETPDAIKNSKGLHLVTQNTPNGQKVQIMLEELAAVYPDFKWETTKMYTHCLPPLSWPMVDHLSQKYRHQRAKERLVPSYKPQRFDSCLFSWYF